MVFIHPQVEMGEKEQKLQTLQSKVSELKKCSQSQETPAKLQVLMLIQISFVLFFYICTNRYWPLTVQVILFMCMCVTYKFVFFLHQVLESDLRKKISTVQKLHEQARGNLMDFTSQRNQLEDYISQMSAWLKSMEDSLVSSPTGSDPEDICRVKVKPK